MICKPQSTNLNSSKYCYVSLISVTCLQTVLFQTIQFSISQSWMVENTSMYH